MLNEKGTVAAMKEAWKHDGYRFILSRGVLSVRGEGWGFQDSCENIPSKALALIAEHFGGFPEDGDAYELQKKGAEQSVTFDVEASWWDGIRMLLDNREAEIKLTPLHLGGFEIWQEQRNLKCFAVNPNKTRIIDNEFLQSAETAGQQPSVLLWNSMGGTIAYVAAGGRQKFEELVARLDGFPWCGEGA